MPLGIITFTNKLNRRIVQKFKIKINVRKMYYFYQVFFLQTQKLVPFLYVLESNYLQTKNKKTYLPKYV